MVFAIEALTTAMVLSLLNAIVTLALGACRRPRNAATRTLLARINCVILIFGAICGSASNALRSPTYQNNGLFWFRTPTAILSLALAALAFYNGIYRPRRQSPSPSAKET